MFSGIVQQLGTIKKITTKDSLKTFCIKFDNSLQCSIGDSVAINGTCLTVTKLDKQNLTANFDAVPETLKKTNLDTLKENQLVNIELAMRYGDHIGGHMVQGHIDEPGQIKSIQNVGGAWLIEISASREFLKYLIKKGFVTIDGMSITVINVLKDSFTVTLIPHTIEVTIAKNYSNGSMVNLETDATGKYIYKYIQGFKENV
ncbi:riboflavin synthase [Francisella tularensis]|uniref:riboflavin synthase n=1 Tax=Francisella tularensis TaxID=263 RepID=UPI000A15435E|nr:riboflavin synthase [Francisella tularensis]MBK2150331.1 riboflavin synthase [Francisella tularensis]MBK2251453.1 riboflavin synthase [Francisella tularensis]NDS81107.1 riboflavin synthase [Francisella tularensis subsp. holarctica]NDT61054.1 riboflavin synthase [Francisella tularensis subsp. holarctica]ORX29553.1 riboflavin synthase subunit alpha [Francisella tularensis subsp. holarctica]